LGSNPGHQNDVWRRLALAIEKPDRLPI